MADPAYQTLRQIRRTAMKARQLRVRLAHEDPSVFAGLVMRDEKTNKPIKMALVHEAWQELATKHDRLLIWSHPESGKTQQLSIARVLWELGRNPSLRVAIISRTDEIAKNIVRVIGNMITQSTELHEVFPNLRKSSQPDARWNEHVLVVERNNPNMKEPSVQAFGEASRSIVSKRLDLLVVDDILDEKNTTSVTQMDDMWTWFNSVIEGRLDVNARVIVVGNAWHPDDFLHRLARMPRWVPKRYPVLEEVAAPDGSQQMVPRWPERWPMWRIQERKKTLDAAKPGEFARTMMCEARDDTQSRFKVASIEKCLANGEGRQLLVSIDGLRLEDQPHLRSIPPGYRIFTGVDLAFQKHSAADFTCFFTIAIAPDGMRHVLCIEAGRWYGPEIRDRAIATHMRFQSIMIVENNGAQDTLLHFIGERSAVPIKPFTTGRNKADPTFGVEMMSVEMDNGKWAIPNDRGVCHPEVAAWIKEMLYYDPLKHTGDRLMASWFAKEGARISGVGNEGPKMETGYVPTTVR